MISAGSVVKSSLALSVEVSVVLVLVVGTVEVVDGLCSVVTGTVVRSSSL